MLKTKTYLRRVMQEQRDTLSAETRLRAAEEAAQLALSLCEQMRGPIALYWPVRNEISPLILAEHLHQRRRMLCLPVIAEHDMPLQFREYVPGDTLHKGRYGIDEPSQKSPFVEPEILIVPLFAFDRTGARLGTGGGYYDRTLMALRAGKTPVHAFGYAFSCQEVDSLPQEPHDQKLDVIVTENNVFVTGK